MPATTCVGNPVGLNLSNLPQVLPTGGGGVSFTPHGRAAAGYTKMGHMGSSESLDSTQSLTLSSYSLGSSTSTGMSSIICIFMNSLKVTIFLYNAFFLSRRSSYVIYCTYDIPFNFKECTSFCIEEASLHYPFRRVYGLLNFLIV